MNEPKRGPKDLTTRERMATIGGASANAMSHMAQGEHKTEEGAEHMMSAAQVEAIVSSWPEAPKRVVHQMMEQYGPPNEGTSTKLFWYHKGPWKRIEATSDIVVHNFPAPHSDYLTHWINYQVPVDKFEEIGRYDGSCLVDRTVGEAGARCDSEAANTITLNLMHEIVIGKRTVDEAREVYAEHMAAYAMGRPALYAERLLFDPPAGETGDPDKSMMAGAILRQGAGKVKDMLTGSEGGPPTH